MPLSCLRQQHVAARQGGDERSGEPHGREILGWLGAVLRHSTRLCRCPDARQVGPQQDIECETSIQVHSTYFVSSFKFSSVPESSGHKRSSGLVAELMPTNYCYGACRAEIAWQTARKWFVIFNCYVSRRALNLYERLPFSWDLNEEAHAAQAFISGALVLRWDFCFSSPQRPV